MTSARRLVRSDVDRRLAGARSICRPRHLYTLKTHQLLALTTPKSIILAISSPLLSCLRTIRMPHLGNKLHLRRRKRIVFREPQLGGEYPPLEGCTLGPLDQCLPNKHVVFADGARGYAFRWVRGKRFIFFEEAFRGRGCHGEGGGWWAVGSGRK